MILRHATDEDRDFFYELRADPVAARMSRRGPITLEEHAHWWAHTTDHRFVAESWEDTNPERVGVCRIGPDGTVSIIVHPEFRGRGFGKQMLALLREEARALRFPRLWAEVAPENIPSARIFIHCGWAPILLEITP